MTTYNETLKQYLCNKPVPPRTEGKVIEYDDEHSEKFGKAIIDGKFTVRISGYSYHNPKGETLHIGDKISFSVVNVNGVIEGVGICMVKKYNIFKSCCSGFIKSYDNSKGVGVIQSKESERTIIFKRCSLEKPKSHLYTENVNVTYDIIIENHQKSKSYKDCSKKGKKSRITTYTFATNVKICE
jgi:hypothetical protein